MPATLWKRIQRFACAHPQFPTLIFLLLLNISCKPRQDTNADVEFLVTDRALMVNAGYIGPALITGEPSLRIRQKPSSSARVVGRAMYGEIVDIMESRDSFARIDRGWIDKRWLQLTKPVAPGHLGEGVVMNRPAVDVFDVNGLQKTPINSASFGQIVRVLRVNQSGFAETELGAISAQHLAKLKSKATSKEEVGDDPAEKVPAPPPDFPVSPLAKNPGAMPYSVSGIENPQVEYCHGYPAELGRAFAAASVSAAARALISLVSFAEGTHKCYNLRFDHEVFFNYAAHPGRCAKTKYKGKCVSASGRFQFIFETWNTLAQQRGYSSFQPHFQDLAGLHLTRQVGVDYDKRYSKSQFRTVMRKMSGKWASLPGSTSGQRQLTFLEAWTKYISYLKD
jgi:muramidase (phage lysozyme)